MFLLLLLLSILLCCHTLSNQWHFWPALSDVRCALYSIRFLTLYLNVIKYRGNKCYLTSQYKPLSVSTAVNKHASGFKHCDDSQTAKSVSLGLNERHSSVWKQNKSNICSFSLSNETAQSSACMHFRGRIAAQQCLLLACNTSLYLTFFFFFGLLDLRPLKVTLH